MQQLILLVAAFIAGCVYLLSINQQIPAGILLALATIKPQLAIPLAAWLLLWSGSKLKTRWKFAGSFAITLLMLIGAGEFLLPGWIHEFRSAVIAYRNYTRAQSILDQLSVPVTGAMLAALVVLAVALAGWRSRKYPADTEDDHFCWTTSLVLASTVVIVPTTAPYNQLLLAPGALLIARTWSESRSVTAAFRVLSAITAACVIWPWILATALAMSFLTPAAETVVAGPLW